MIAAAATITPRLATTRMRSSPSDVRSALKPPRGARAHREHERQPDGAELHQEAEVRVLGRAALEVVPAVDEDLLLGAEAVAEDRPVADLLERALPRGDPAARDRRRRRLAQRAGGRSRPAPAGSSAVLTFGRTSAARASACVVPDFGFVFPAWPSWASSWPSSASRRRLRLRRLLRHRRAQAAARRSAT